MKLDPGIHIDMHSVLSLKLGVTLFDVTCCICMFASDVCLHEVDQYGKRRKNQQISSKYGNSWKEQIMFVLFYHYRLCICGTIVIFIFHKMEEPQKQALANGIFHFHFHRQMCIEKMMPKKHFLIFMLVSILKF